MDPFYSFEVGRGLFLKGLLCCYFIANANLIFQITGLLGRQGVIPVEQYNRASKTDIKPEILYCLITFLISFLLFSA